MKKVDIRVTVNGRVYTDTVEPRLLLSDWLRHHIQLKGTHVGCEHGVCGACTVLFKAPATASDDPDATPEEQAVRSCLMFAVQADGAEIRTVEGLAAGPDQLHPLQEAFREEHALQCGFCTPGFLMTLVPFLREHRDPTDEEIREVLSGNICRCTGYEHIVKAVKRALRDMRESADERWL